MKRHITSLPFGACLMLACMLFPFASQSLMAQTRLWISGSAVPGGTQELTRFSTGTSGKYTFKFHGTLLPGTLLVQNTEQRRAATMYYAPKQVDSNVVNNGIQTVQTRDTTQAAWAVLFGADNYRFTVSPSDNLFSGELFAQWYEAWVVGGCVEDNQGSGSTAGQWQLSAGKAMKRSVYNPYEWSWVGELKVYKANDESNRLKINGQYGWTPKALHPFVADQKLTSATQFWYCGPNDTKWTISQDGYYSIVVDVFRETMKAVYLGKELPDGIQATTSDNSRVDVDGRRVRISADRIVTCRLFTTDGHHVATQNGMQVELQAPRRGVYLLYVDDGDGGTSRKIMIE